MSAILSMATKVKTNNLMLVAYVLAVSVDLFVLDYMITKALGLK